MPPKAKMRPAAAPGRLRIRRPAARDPNPPATKTLGELGAVELNNLGLIRLEDAGYYHRKIQVVGKAKGFVAEGGESFLHLELSGTQDEELLRVVSGRGDRMAKVHLCSAGCQEQLTGEVLLHGKKYTQVRSDEVDWYTNLGNGRRLKSLQERRRERMMMRMKMRWR